jgi:pilus assembly protein CpaB
MLQPGMRAVAVPVTVESAAGGFILPGDRVDVVMSRKVDVPNPNGGGNTQVAAAETVLKNLRVLAIDQKVKPDADAKAIVGAVATLELPAEDANVLIRARAQGELALILRSYADMGGPSGRAEANVAQSQSVRIVRAGRSSDVMIR